MKSSSILRVVLPALVLLAVFATACSSTTETADGDRNDSSSQGNGSSGEDGSSQSATGSTSQGVAVSIEGPGQSQGDTQVIITLDDAMDGGDDAPLRETTVEGDPLDTDGVAQLLNRLPDLQASSTDEVDFNRPPDTRPRPRPGATAEQAFPPAGSDVAPQPATGPLEVLRFQPEGPVDLAPFISVTFNQPMVALSTVSQVESADVPISITPEMPGRWIWLGTRTARFEYEAGAIDRIPAATSYEVEIPAGTTSATGVELTDGVRFEFSTPTPQVRTVQPLNSSLALDSIFFISFDQRVEPDAVLGAIELRVNGSDTNIRLATGDEINEDPLISRLTENALPERWVAIRPVEELPTDASIELRVGPNVPSAEGPETSDAVDSRTGRTYGDLRITGSRCGWGDECLPGQQLKIELSNPIDTELFAADMVTVDPDIPGMRIGVSGDGVTIQGLTQGRTTYIVTLDQDLTDIYGQQLGDEQPVRFTIDDSPPALFRPGRSIITLDPIVDDGRLNVSSINNDELKVTVYEVEPGKDWDTFQRNGWEIALQERDFGWNRLAERTVPTGGEANAFVETALDLSNELDGGHVVVVVAPNQRRGDEWQNEPFAVWVQNTKLGLDATTDSSQAYAWVTDLATGEPLPGATVQIIGGENATTNEQGVAQLELPSRATGMYATVGDDTALIGEYWGDRYTRNDQVRWYVVDDRGIYKPGETARVKGWIRTADADIPSRLSLPDSSAGAVRWLARDAFGNEIDEGEASLSPLGGFDLEVELPDDITLGSAGIEFSTIGAGANGQYWHELTVQEFRRPDFEVSATVAGEGPYLVGQAFTVEAQADYFAGGALGASPVDWSVSGNLSSYSPPKWPEFTFGIWVPWWLGFHDDGFDDFGREFGGGGFGGAAASEFFNAQTSASGEHGLSVTIDTDGKPRPVTVTTSATVTDVTRQPISGSATTLVHPAELYVGLKGSRTFVRAGERLDLDVIVTDIDGNAVAGQNVTVTSVRLDWQFVAGSWTEVEVPSESCDVTSTEGAMVCTFRPEDGGRYRMSATVTDTNGRENLTELTRWVAGEQSRPTSRRVDLEEVTLVPNAQNYQPGDTAEVLVQSPFSDAHGIVVIARGAIDRVETIEFDPTGSAVVQIPITADDIPGIGLRFEVAGSAPRSSGGDVDTSLPPRPAYASGQLTLTVPPDERGLAIDVAPRVEKLEPGADTQVDVQVTNYDGNPVADAELLVVVVDEAVLSLTNYELDDPLEAFYARIGGLGQTFRGRTSLLLSDPQIGGEGDGGGGGGGDESELASAPDAVEESADFAMDDTASGLVQAESMRAAPTAAALPTLQAASTQKADGETDEGIELRTNFDALAVFEPEVTTDAQGRATIDVPLPDNLTRYRVMVVATANATDAGTGESNITARLPITVRPTPPRFANFGDVFEFPVIVQNATDGDIDVDVALRSTNLNVDGRAGTTVTVPANDRVEVRFDVSAVEAGTARYQIAASSGPYADAAEGDFPVYTPATAEAFATYGVVDSGSVAQPFTEPQGVFPQFGGLEITTSSTAVAALTDAMIYMSEYRYENSDAFASRIIAIVSLDDILTAFDAEQLPSPDALRDQMNSDIDRLSSMQNSDGGFPYWRRGRESIPYNTVQATHALILAEKNGYSVDEQVMANAKFYLAAIEDFYPSWYSDRTRRSISAYALHVRNLSGDSDVTKATGVFERAGDEMELDAAAWLWPVLADTPLDGEIELLLRNRVTETPNAATFATRYSENDWVLLHSDRRTDAIVLEALVGQRPASDLILKTLNGILAARDRYGRWTNVQENSFVLLAGAAYFDEFEDADPDFIARAWLGDDYALEHSYEGRSTERNLTIVPMSELVDVGDTDIVVARDGDAGRLYYRLGLRYAPTDFNLEPRDQGFVVQRSYQAIDDDTDVVRNDDGTWQVKAGARVRVTLTMVADSRRTHVALIDPIPAGFEIVNPALATSEPIPQADPSETSLRGYWWYNWFDHQNFRDDRAEAFSTWLGAGSYEFSYVARATTPGTFVTPPTRAEQIYEPEVFGRSSSTTVTVTDS